MFLLSRERKTKLNIEKLLYLRKNNFDTIRFLAAALVIFSHAYPLTGNDEPWAKFYQSSYGGLGVGVFLVISGFLIAFSWDRNPDIYSFLKNRVLRIFPALIASVFLVAFVLGPLVTTLTTKEYFTNNLLYEYLKMISLYNVQFNLPGVFAENPYPNTVNGSLWTIEYEFTFYLLIVLLGVLKFFDKRVILLLCSISIILYSGNAFFEHSLYTLHMSSFWKFLTFFLVGILYYMYRDKITISKTYAGICLFVVLFSIPFGGLNHISFLIFGVYLIIYFGLTQEIKIPNLSKYGDVSYGLYVYAFPCQQLLTFLYNDISPFENFVFALLFTLILSYISWHLIEKPALKLKNVSLLSINLNKFKRTEMEN